MKPKLKLLLALAILLVFPTTKAADTFLIDYDITYDIYPNGETQVTQNINITNLQSDVVATSYSLAIRKNDVYEISGFDAYGALDIERTDEDDLINLTALFNQQAIGEGKSTNFTIKYKTKDIATKTGNIWTLNIPRAQTAQNANTYNVKIVVPKELGPDVFISPVPENKEITEVDYVYTYSKDYLLNTGITASFGTYQTVNFKLTYQLENTSKLPKTYEIALPPDKTTSQQVSFDLFTPEPEDIYFDKDGNTMATFKLKGSQKLDIELVGSARIYARQIQPEEGGKLGDIPLDLKSKYTGAQKYWEIGDESIKTIANTLYEPDLTVSENAHKIYNYLVKSQVYNFDIINQDSAARKGAKQALADKQPIACMEFTDLFIAIARAQGIPAREINGFAFPSNPATQPLSINIKGGDVLHAWPEFYDPKFGWVQIDPTWGNTSTIDYFTKLDNNHFAFVTKGLNSEYPLPAGTYKLNPEQKLVEVDFAQNTPSSFDNNLTLKKKLTLNIFELFKGNRSYTIINNGGNFVYNIQTADKVINYLKPYHKINAYLPQGTPIVTFENINGNTIQSSPKIVTGKLPENVAWQRQLGLYAKLAISIGTGLVLYMIFYFLPNLPMVLKKSTPLQRLLHRVRDLLPNRH